MDENDELTLALAAVMLAAASPDEAALLDALGPEALRVEPGSGSDGALGFGGVEMLLLGAVVAIAKTVGREATLEFGRELAKEYAVQGTKGLVDRLLLALRNRRDRRPGDPDPGPILSTRGAAHARERAYQQAVTLGIDSARAALLADAIGGALGLPGGSASPSPG